MKKIYILCVFSILSSGCALNSENIEQVHEAEQESIENFVVVEANDDGERFHSLPTQEPQELTNLLSLESSVPIDENKESEVLALRPQAIRDAAQLVTIQTAIKWRYEQLIEETERYSYLLDTGFNFTPLLMVNDEEILVMPPILTQTEEAMRIENDGLVTTTQATYEMLENARYISVVPNWRVYMMTNAFPEPEQANPAVLPRNAEERALWQSAVREAWGQGISQANELYTANLSRLVRDYKGITLYHLLVAKNHVSEFSMSSSSPTTNIDGDTMFLEQKVFRITSPSQFQVNNNYNEDLL